MAAHSSVADPNDDLATVRYTEKTTVFLLNGLATGDQPQSANRVIIVIVPESMKDKEFLLSEKVLDKSFQEQESLWTQQHRTLVSLQSLAMFGTLKGTNSTRGVQEVFLFHPNLRATIGTYHSVSECYSCTFSRLA